MIFTTVFIIIILICFQTLGQDLQELSNKINSQINYTLTQPIKQQGKTIYLNKKQFENNVNTNFTRIGNNNNDILPDFSQTLLANEEELATINEKLSEVIIQIPKNNQGLDNFEVFEQDEIKFTSPKPVENNTSYFKKSKRLAAKNNSKIKPKEKINKDFIINTEIIKSEILDVTHNEDNLTNKKNKQDKTSKQNNKKSKQDNKQDTYDDVQIKQELVEEFVTYIDDIAPNNEDHENKGEQIIVEELHGGMLSGHQDVDDELLSGEEECLSYCYVDEDNNEQVS